MKDKLEDAQEEIKELHSKLKYKEEEIEKRDLKLLKYEHKLN